MSHKLNLHAGDGIIAEDPSLGILLAYGNTVPANATAGYAPGARFIKTDGTTLATQSYFNSGTKASASFVAEGLAGAFVASYQYGDVIPIDYTFFVADRACRILSLIVRPLVVGSDVGAVTIRVRKVPSGTAPASGSLVHSSNADLKGTINVNQQLSILTTSAIDLAAGDGLAIQVTGTATDARGVLCMSLLPL